jgi:hypothetical protein
MGGVYVLPRTEAGRKKCNWIFKVKPKNGEIKRSKARLIARKDCQKELYD